MNEIVNKEEEIKKIDEKLKKLQVNIDYENKMLGNQNFLAKAPAKKIEEEKEKLKNFQDSYDALLLKRNELSK